MQSDIDDEDHDQPQAIRQGDTATATTTRAEAQRERFRKSQLIAAQVARARTAGGLPSEGEAARLIAEFHARGGQVTVCPVAEEAPPGKDVQHASAGASR